VPAQVNMLIKALLVFAVMLLQSPQFRASVRGWVRRPEPGAGR
jgi:simple sugar transport system permease protein